MGLEAIGGATVVRRLKEEEENPNRDPGDIVLGVCGPGWAKSISGVEQEVQRGQGWKAKKA